jgi:CheY-like chemotaxis protein
MWTIRALAPDCPRLRHKENAHFGNNNMECGDLFTPRPNLRHLSTAGREQHSSNPSRYGDDTMKILAVDDDPIILELLKEFVSMIGKHDLTVVESGQAAISAIEAAGATAFDCFMLDIQMPKMDGIELTSRIRKISAYTDAPIVMLTAMSQKDYIDRAFSAGATDYVTKPFEVTELKARLGMVEALVSARRFYPTRIHSANSDGSTFEKTSEKHPLHEPLFINDLDNVIECIAMENYVLQLSRSALLGSTVFAFTIRQIESYYSDLSSFDFHGMIEDAAEVISDCLAEHQNLITYAGNGTFVCIVESGYSPNMESLKDCVNIAFSRAELYRAGGERIQPRVSVGQSIRLIWKTGDGVLNALSQAQVSAEAAAAEFERGRFDYFEYKQIA